MSPITVPHHAVVRELPPSGRPCCGHCGGPLHLHQPHFGRPDRLGGYCAACDAWVLVVRGLAIDIDLDGVAAEAIARIGALRRGRVPAPHMRLVTGAPAEVE